MWSKLYHFEKSCAGNNYSKYFPLKSYDLQETKQHHFVPVSADSMESTLLAESLRQQRPDVKIFEALKISLRNEIVSWVSMKLLTSVNLDDDTVLAFSTVRREQNGSSAVIMSCLSTEKLTSNVPPLFLGLLSAEVNCGVFVTVRGLQLYATGDSDGSITLFSCTKQKVILAELNNSDNRSRPVLQIIHSPYKKETSRVCFWVAYPGIIEQITCKIIDDSVSQFVRTISLAYDEVEFGRFNYFKVFSLHRNLFSSVLHYLHDPYIILDGTTTSNS